MEHRTSGQLIQFFRERSGFSKEVLAEVIQVSTTKLSHWESDETAPRPSAVEKLVGALGLSSAEAFQLETAVSALKAAKKKEEAEAQAVIDAERAEAQRLIYKEKALRLFLLGVIGFIGGFIFAALRGGLQSVWYFPFVIGAAFAGVPYGWSLITSKDEEPIKEVYTADPEQDRTNFLIKIGFYLLKFIAACAIGILGYPIVLLYHAYKAGKKGSLFKALMLVALIVVMVFWFIFVAAVVLSSTKNR